MATALRVSEARNIGQAFAWTAPPLLLRHCACCVFSLLHAVCVVCFTAQGRSKGPGHSGFGLTTFLRYLGNGRHC